MNIGKTCLQRAFELAGSGKCLKVAEVIMRLKAERYDVDQVEGPSLRKQLAEQIQKATGTPASVAKSPGYPDVE